MTLALLLLLAAPPAPKDAAAIADWERRHHPGAQPQPKASAPATPPVPVQVDVRDVACGHAPGGALACTVSACVVVAGGHDESCWHGIALVPAGYEKLPYGELERGLVKSWSTQGPK